MNREMNQSGTAAVLSFVFSGLGQLYKGQLFKGLVIIFLAALSIFLTVIGAVLIYVWLTQQILLQLFWIGVTLFVVGLISICIIGIYSIVDAYKQGQNQ